MAGGTPPEDLRQPRPRSRIAQERLQPGAAGWGFILSVGALSLAVFTFLALVTHRPAAPTAAEDAARLLPGATSALHNLLGLQATRLLAAASASLLVSAVAVAARRLLRSDLAAILAAWLVALDPGLLAVGHMAVPHAFVLAASFGSLALFLLPAPRLHWGASLLLSIACLFDPAALLWGLPLALLVLVRGHIYAAPIHLGQALVQTLGGPALAAAIVAWGRQGSDALATCLRPSAWEGLLLARYQDLGGPIVLPDPAIWFAGLTALAGLASGTVWHVVRTFRFARIPGRMQLRLPAPLRSFQARILWIALLALAVPHPLAWLPIAALGLAAGVQVLTEDAPGFGVTVGAVAAVFAAMWALRAWGLILGTASPEDVAEVLTIVPWSSPLGC